MARARRSPTSANNSHLLVTVTYIGGRKVVVDSFQPGGIVALARISVAVNPVRSTQSLYFLVRLHPFGFVVATLPAVKLQCGVRVKSDRGRLGGSADTVCAVCAGELIPVCQGRGRPDSPLAIGLRSPPSASSICAVSPDSQKLAHLVLTSLATAAPPRRMASRAAFTSFIADSDVTMILPPFLGSITIFRVILVLSLLLILSPETTPSA